MTHPGCGCALCRQPLPEPTPLSPVQSLALNRAYEADRALYRLRFPHVSREQLAELEAQRG